MSLPTREEIARLIYENHEEQCCTCGPWPGIDPERWLKPADAILARLAADKGR